MTEEKFKMVGGIKVFQGRDYLPPGFPYDDEPDDSPEAEARREAMTPESLKQHFAKQKEELRKKYPNVFKNR